MQIENISDLSESHSEFALSPITPKNELFFCPFKGCEKSFKYKSEIQRHLISHNNSKPFVCNSPFCNRSFKRQDALRVHLQSHTENPQFFCPISGCSASFKTQPARRYHLKKDHPSEFKALRNSSRFLCHQEPNIKRNSMKTCDFNTFQEENFEDEDFNIEPRKLLHIEEKQESENESEVCSTDLSESFKISVGFPLGNYTSKLTDTNFLESLHKKLILQNEEFKKLLTDKMTALS